MERQVHVVIAGINLCIYIPGGYKGAYYVIVTSDGLILMRLESEYISREGCKCSILVPINVQSKWMNTRKISNKIIKTKQNQSVTVTIQSKGLLCSFAQFISLLSRIQMFKQLILYTAIPFSNWSVWKQFRLTTGKFI